MKKITHFLACSALLAGMVQAQPLDTTTRQPVKVTKTSSMGNDGKNVGQQSPSNANPGSKIRAVLFRLAPRLTQVYAFDPDDQTGAPGVKLDVKDYLNDIGSSLPLKGNTVILTTSESRSSLSKPESIVANVKIGASKTSLILMLIPGTGKPGDPMCRALVYDSRTSVFPVASYQITNLSPYPVKYELGSDVYEFKPGEMKLIKKLPMQPGETAPMVASCFKNNQWQRIASSVWSHPGTSREIQVLFENPKNNRVEMDGFQDTSFDP
jgi:hypothetical protein